MENIPHYNYVFHYTDHLGNVRVSWTETPGAPGERAIIDDSHYYPFGLKHQGYNAQQQTHQWSIVAQTVELVPVTPLFPKTYKYGFGGMEEQEEWQVYDFGARNGACPELASGTQRWVGG